MILFKQKRYIDLISVLLWPHLHHALIVLKIGKHIFGRYVALGREFLISDFGQLLVLKCRENSVKNKDSC